MKQNNTQSHPFAQVSFDQAEQVSGGLKLVDGIKLPESKITSIAAEGGVFTTALGEDGKGPVYTTLAVGEEGGNLPVLF